MNPVINAILSHASIRRFTNEDVPDELIEQIARAGQQAPWGRCMLAFIPKIKPSESGLASCLGLS
ncbi:MAG: hypothetical protein GX060_04635 [Firmicutes bacterium]|nr:hypothetical protein [Bacillota bacterium]